MKNIFTLFSLLGLFFAGAQQIKWMSFNEALAAQKNLPKKILVQFYDESNAGSRKMDLGTFKNPVVVRYINQFYYPVKFNSGSRETVNIYGRSFRNTSKNITSTHELTQFMSVHAYPTTVFLDENLEPITSLMGVFTAKEIEPYLSMIGTNTYKEIKTKKSWETYRQEFKYSIK